jgi:hypothetical protein
MVSRPAAAADSTGTNVPVEIVDPPEQLLPLSVLELDLTAPVEGWTAYLNSRSIPVVEDDLGRLAVARDAARRLFHRQWRAQLPSGVPWYEIPPDVLPVVAMTQADRDAQPKPLSPLQEALSGESMVYHRLGSTPDEE